LRLYHTARAALTTSLLEVKTPFSRLSMAIHLTGSLLRRPWQL